ncbi:MAG: type IV toxin-antitoxin system AbiEi family antitoxin, partial [Gammaproteobacteria bacterium]
EKSGPIAVADVTKILRISSISAAQKLARWAKNGWLCRVKRGLYVPVPLASLTSNIAIEDAWLLADSIYKPCYIGGWSAAEYWGMTEQIFNTVLVMTTQKVHERDVEYQNIKFRIKTVTDGYFFGLKNVWRGQTKVNFSDPERTLVDMLYDPSLGGGIRSVLDVLKSYFEAKPNPDLIIRYAKRFNKGVVFKRLGFLCEKFFPDKLILTNCQKLITKGYSRLDPALPGKKIITKWRLRLPEGWKNER